MSAPCGHPGRKVFIAYIDKDGNVFVTNKVAPCECADIPNSDD